jgi:stage II sporulation protein M
MREKYNFIYKNFLISLKELKKLRNYFIFSLILFFSFSIIGMIFPHFFEDKIIDLIKSLIEKTENLNIFELFVFITANNIQVAFIGIIFGVLFGIVPTLALIVNGYVLGFIINKSIISEGIFIIWRLFPHGIFEIPAVLISTSIGIRLGTDLKNFKKNLKSSIRIFILIIVPLLVIAGIIESLLVVLI